MDVFTTLAARPAGQGHYVVPMDPRDPEPEIYRCCSASEQEMTLIRMITDSIVRLGYVTSIGVDEITLTKGSLPTGPGTVHIDCSARGQLGLPPLPIWSGKEMVPQPVFFCNQALSSALLGYLEARFPDDEEKKNLLGAPIPATHTLIAAANSALPEPPLSRLAGVHGKPSSPAGSNGQRATDVGKRAVLPEDVRGVLQRMESRPVLARRGQAVAFTPGLLHDSSPNLSTDGVRKRLTFTYCPGTPEGGAPLVEMSEPAAELVAAMRELLPAERRHLLKAEPGPSSKL